MVGKSAILQNGANVTVTRVISSQSSPVSESDALPRIQMYLANKKATAEAERALKDLKAKAKITYQGEFVEGASTPAAPTPEAASTGGTDAVIEKGAASLK